MELWEYMIELNGKMEISHTQGDPIKYLALKSHWG